MDMTDVPSNAPTGPRRGGSSSSSRGGRSMGRKRALAISNAESDDITMGSSTSERPARKTRSTASGSHSSASTSQIKRASSAPYNAAKRPSRTNAIKPPANASASAPGLFRKAALAAATDSAGASKSGGGAVEMLKSFLARRYQPEAHLLNLDNMADDEIFKGPHALTAPGFKSQTRSSAALAMWKLVREKYPDVISLSLAHNKLSGVSDLAPAALIHALPNLQNLSLAHNNIREVKHLNSLTSDESIGRAGLACIRELVLEGNPVWDEAAQTGDFEKIKRQIALRFPTLSVLNGLQLTPTAEPKPVNTAAAATTPLGSGLKKDAHFPVAMRPGYMDESKDVVAAFLTQFFALYDKDRQSLQIAYAPESTFSLSVNSFIPHRSFHSKDVQALPKQHTLHWKPYFNQSRNMVQTNKLPPEQLQQNIETRLYSGPQNIVAALKDLPTSEHPISESEKFVVDAWAQPGLLAGNAVGLFVTVHGQFFEEPGRGLRSFDRTFVLAPPAAGSPAQQAGWPCVVISDLLVLRGYTEPKAWAENALPVSSQPLQPPAPSTSSAPSESGSLSPEQQNMVLQLQQETKLTTAFAVQCLSESGWDLATAFSNFQAVQSQVPPEAFIH